MEAVRSARRKKARRDIEHCWILLGRRLGRIWYARRARPTTGDLASVEFDGSWVLEREESRGDVCGFYHTHPSGSPRPSARDLATMRAWCDSFGKSLLCLIESPQGLAAYRFDDDESRGEELELAERFPRGVVVAVERSEIEEENES